MYQMVVEALGDEHPHTAQQEPTRWDRGCTREQGDLDLHLDDSSARTEEITIESEKHAGQQALPAAAQVTDRNEDHGSLPPHAKRVAVTLEGAGHSSTPPSSLSLSKKSDSAREERQNEDDSPDGDTVSSSKNKAQLQGAAKSGGKEEGSDKIVVSHEQESIAVPSSTGPRPDDRGNDEKTEKGVKVKKRNSILRKKVRKRRESTDKRKEKGRPLFKKI